MDYSMVQLNLVKEANARDCKFKNFNSKYGKYKNKVGLIIDNASTMVLIPETAFYLDISKIFKNAEAMNIESVINMKNSKVLINTKQMVVTDKYNLCVFQNDEHEKFYVNERLLKTFKSIKKPIFVGTDAKSPIYVFEEDDLVGLVLPVRHHEN
ncbi:MAG: hypothetical protein Q4F03_04815 [Eubacteriales bacterium]|nr:hypothetical protein [Eubacteriales bacterium]